MRCATLVLAAALGAACGGETEAAPPRARADRLVAVDELCATRGAAAPGARVTAPTMRAVALGTSGDRAALEFVYRGDTDDRRAFASGPARRQLGLKLRAADGCNLVYVMWRLDPAPMLDVSVKRNPGARDHAACGANGYTKVRPTQRARVPALVAGARHELRAAIAGDVLTAWIDDVVAWRGTLPASARRLAGPTGLRSDNLAFDLVRFAAARSHRVTTETCRATVGD